MAEQQIALEIEPTEDGSPTLRTTYASGPNERMHHGKGALSETLYIYGEALSLALKWDVDPLMILSVGLGLGYNEMMSLAIAQSEGKAEKIRIHSFESNSRLIQAFESWASGSTIGEFYSAYSWISNELETRFALSPGDLPRLCQRAREEGRLELRGEFQPAKATESTYNVVFYDAFSRKMDPGLWSEEDLKQFLKTSTATPCLVTTYAATGALNRALKANGFELADRRGFAGKRESTLAIRLVFK